MLSPLRKKVDRKLVELKAARERLREEKKLLEVSCQHHEDVLEAQQIVQQIAQRIQQRAHDQIAGVVSRCLAAVFDEPYTFKILFERKRGRTEARLVFERDSLTVDPLTASGGGVVDVAAFALRIACVVLNKPSLRRFLILDEPFKFLSIENRGRMRGLLESLSKEMGVQLVMITHIGEFQAGKVIELS